MTDTATHTRLIDAGMDHSNDGRGTVKYVDPMLGQIVSYDDGRTWGILDPDGWAPVAPVTYHRLMDAAAVLLGE